MQTELQTRRAKQAFISLRKNDPPTGDAITRLMDLTVSELMSRTRLDRMTALELHSMICREYDAIYSNW